MLHGAGHGMPMCRSDAVRRRILNFRYSWPESAAPPRPADLEKTLNDRAHKQLPSLTTA